MKVAILGLGSAGTRHARNLLDIGHEVVGFDPAAPEAPTGIEIVDSLDAALAIADAAIVASPNAFHADQALAALERGRHILVEKPLATSVPAAERVATAAAEARVVCGVAMNLRFHPGVAELKRLVDELALGALRFAQASFGYDLRLWHPGSDYRQGYSARAELGGGIIFDAIHELDYLLWLLGPVASVAAEAAHVSDLEVDIEDVAVAALRFESGALGSVDLNFIEPAYRRGCLIVGSSAVAHWDWQQAVVTVRRDGCEDAVADVRCDFSDTYRAELADWLRAIAEGAEPMTPARDGVAAVRLADALKRSSLAGRRVSLDPAS